MQKITPFLWFDENAEEAVNFYTSIFKNSKIKRISRYKNEPAAVPGHAPGSVMTITFELEGQEFTAMNGGPGYKFTPAISLMVNCKTQEEVDYYWDALARGGQEVQCGWLTDKYGMSWQITPIAMMDMLHDKDEEKAKRAMQAMMQMVKLDVNKLKQAYDGK